MYGFEGCNQKVFAFQMVHPFSDFETWTKMIGIHVDIYMCKLSSVGYVTATFTYDDAVQ